MRHLAVLLTIMAVLLGIPVSAAEVTGHARAIDGDTLDLAGTRVRLHGIDAPESGQHCRDGAGRDYACGVAATEMLRTLIGRRPLTCVGGEWDDYGRLIAVCHQGGREINAEMVQSGWAQAFRRYSHDYAADEEDAAVARRGLWAGSFEPPWEFRRARWQAASTETPRPACPIKGNISKNGRIYHMPYSRDYHRTVINPAKGERWFCSEAEAIAAGWRAARN